jgi:hypothetical protein
MARCKVDDFVVEKSRYSRLASSYGERIIAWILLRNSEDRGEKKCRVCDVINPITGSWSRAWRPMRRRYRAGDVGWFH